MTLRQMPREEGGRQRSLSDYHPALKNRPRAAHVVFLRPVSSLCLAESPPQPSADVRAFRDRLRLRLCRPGRSRRPARSVSRGSEADYRPARREDRRQGGRRSLPMGRRLPRLRLRLLRARVLDLCAVGHRAPAQLVRALRPGPTSRTIEDEGRRPALLLRARTRRHLHRPRAHGARAALRHTSSDRQAAKLVVRRAHRRRPPRRQVVPRPCSRVAAC
jgi:hypothetical protein